MKKSIFQLMACVAVMGTMLTSCQDVHEAYSNVPTVSEVTVSGSQQELAMTLNCYEPVDYPYNTQGYFLLSQSADMSNAQQLWADYDNSTGEWTAAVDLLPATTYYAQLCLERPHGKVESAVKEFTTSELGRVSVSSVTAYGAHLYYSWRRTDYSATFLVADNADMSGAKEFAALRSGSSGFYTNVSELTPTTKYYAAIRLTGSGGITFTTPATEFSTLTPASVSLADSEYSGYGGFFVVGPDGTITSNASGYSWEGTITGETSVYVYKPYQKGSFTYENVPLTYSQEYFEYGRTTISPTNTNANCEMHQLLPYQVVLNITPESTNGATTTKYISYVSIANAGNATAISTNATFNLATQTPTPVADNGAAWPQYVNIPLSSGKTTSRPFRSIIPAKFSEGEVTVLIRLNDTQSITTEVVPVTLPAANWEGGKEYSIDLKVRYTRTDVNVTVSDVKVTPWGNGGSTNIDIYD